MQTSEQMWRETGRWIAANPKAFAAVERAAAEITDAGEHVPMQFVMEMLRYNGLFGEELMHRLVRLLSGITLADGKYAVPNGIVAGVSRVLKARDETLNIRTAASKLDEKGVPDAILRADDGEDRR